MTTEENFFFDTYAILEIISGSGNYKNYLEIDPIITRLNLFELYYSLRKMYDKKKALLYFHRYADFVINFDEFDIEVAADLKIRNKKLSMADCIGYAAALRNNVKFLTGDKEFKGMLNVEFVK